MARVHTRIYTTIAAEWKSVFTLPSSQLDENLPVRSQFYSDHRVNFSTHRCCQSATFGPLTFCVYPLLLRPKIIEKTTKRWKRIERRKLWSAQRECQTAGRVAQRECQTAGRVAAKRPTGCCWSSESLQFWNLLSFRWTFKNVRLKKKEIYTINILASL